MTHFSPSISALPLSPFLVVKLWPILTPEFMINFWPFLVTFCLNYVNFSENVDFAIKNHCFLSFFDTKFDQFFIIFVTFLGSFLGFLGGYPSPSISAPLVVKKCPKLYIYIIWGTPPLWYITHATVGLWSWKTSKCSKRQNAQNDKTQMQNHKMCKMTKLNKPQFW